MSEDSSDSVLIFHLLGISNKKALAKQLPGRWSTSERAGSSS
jgi:hypothetical protein